ncbi:hypothetical protein BM524_01345 [Alteromonas mediterranea]|uniref:Uncharacterized protein n=1 Tax=Alteromonas mediterranea TaxID=314275 RepID=A0AAC9NPZ9_9ALTE|nr:hypothetical protein [Alteromonas mediterranea]APD88563.1 hypothetical protein BM524_01345 [Alteromonas mediterranea]
MSTLSACRVTEKIQLTLDCSYEITDSLYKIAGELGLGYDSSDIPHSILSQHSISERCNLSEHKDKDRGEEKNDHPTYKNVPQSSTNEVIQTEQRSQRWSLLPNGKTQNYSTIAPEGFKFVEDSAQWHFTGDISRVRTSVRVKQYADRLVAEVFISDGTYNSSNRVLQQKQIGGYFTFKLQRM